MRELIPPERTGPDPALTPVARDCRLPLSYAQEQMWLLHQLDANAAGSNVALTISLRGGLDAAVLRFSLDALVARHETLHTSFARVDGRLAQIIHPAAAVEWSAADLSLLTGQARDDERARLVRESANKPFPDISRPPLLRAQLIRLGPSEHVCVFTFHHIIVDYWSLRLFAKELLVGYESGVREGAAPPPMLPIQYADYAVWQRRFCESGALASDLAYWKVKLEGAPRSLDLPSDLPPPQQTSPRGAVQTVMLPAALAGSLRALAAEADSTLFPVLYSALNILLARWTGRHDIVLGTVAADRERKETQDMIGCLVNFLPLRCRLADDMPALEAVKQARDTALEAFARVHCPFTMLLDAVRPKHGGERGLYNIGLLMFNFAWDQLSSSISGSLQVSAQPVPTDTAQLDLRFLIRPLATGEIGLSCEYRLDLFSSQTVVLLLESYMSVLEQLAARPQASVGEFALAEGLLGRLCRARPSVEMPALAIASTFNAERLGRSLEFWTKELELPFRIEQTSYNQVFQQLLDPNSTFSLNRRGINLLLLRLEDWLKSGASVDQAKRNIEELASALRTPGPGKAAHIVCVCRPSPTADDARIGARAAELEGRLHSALRGIPGVHTISWREIDQAYPVSDYHDAHADEISHTPYSPAHFAALGTMIARRIHALLRRPYKLVVVDCDWTLWKGVCGEDGPDGIEIDAAYRALQEFLVLQHDAGMLIAVCSKNAEEDVAAVFERRCDMPLKREHVIAWKVNWRPKSENIRALCAELKLGADTCVFIDDSPVECAEVSGALPELLTLQLPADPSDIPQFLRHVWAFDHLVVTDEDRQRTALYRQNIERDRLQEQSLTFKDFLAGLKLEISIAPLSPEQLGRVSELTQRTNQFNLTTIRRGEAELQSLCADGRHECLVVRLKDRLGDYGIVGAMVDSAGTEALEVDTFLLSCRALGRGVEHRMLAQLAQNASARGLTRVDLTYKPTKRNQPARDFLLSVGQQFSEDREDGLLFRIPVETAASVTYEPRAEPPQAADPGDGTTSAPQEGGDDSRAVVATLRRIARQLRSPQLILAAMAAESPGPAVSRPVLSVEYVEPSTALERRLTEVWRQALRIDQVGVEDNFFDLGGNSLLLAEVHAQLQSSLGREFPLMEMVRRPSIRPLAAYLDPMESSG